MTLWRLYLCETLLEGLAQDLQDVAAELRQLIEKEHPMVRQRHLAGHRHLAAADQADIRDRVRRGATRAGRDPCRAGVRQPATRWMRMVSMAPGRVMVGRMVVSWRASLDVPAPGDRAAALLVRTLASGSASPRTLRRKRQEGQTACVMLSGGPR
jgi:hypothetical protein